MYLYVASAFFLKNIPRSRQRPVWFMINLINEKRPWIERLLKWPFLTNRFTDFVHIYKLCLKTSRFILREN
jgi:hypothetical protein